MKRPLSISLVAFGATLLVGVTGFLCGRDTVIRLCRRSRNLGVLALGTAFAILANESHAGLVITPTFTNNFNSDFGSNAADAQAAWVAAANIFTTNFSDNIHINITVDAVADRSVFAQSQVNLLAFQYSDMRNALITDQKSANDRTAVGSAGSITAANPNGTSQWVLTTAQAKAIGMRADDASNDGKTTFGAGYSFTFSSDTIAGSTYDFKAAAAHEIAEVMGRVGGNVRFGQSLLDAYAYTDAGLRDMPGGTNNYFSINGGTTLIKLFNNPVNGGDPRDWGAGGGNDAFNAFSSSGVTNPVSAVDLQLMDVLGYDLAAVPEPPNSATIYAVALLLISVARRAKSNKRVGLAA
jgi:hypothetical protein